MAAPMIERTVLPPAEPLAALAAMLDGLGAEPTTTLSGPNGEHLVLPPEVFEVLRDVVDAMAQGQAVTIAPVHQRLTTQEAADLLGVSRPTVVKLLESGEIPFEQPGRHRRVRLADVLAYRERASIERRAALNRMVEIADEADVAQDAAEALAPWPRRPQTAARHQRQEQAEDERGGQLDRPEHARVIRDVCGGGNRCLVRARPRGYHPPP